MSLKIPLNFRFDLTQTLKSNQFKLTYAKICWWDEMMLKQHWELKWSWIFSLSGIRTSPTPDGDWCFLRVQVTRFPPRIGCCKPPEDGLLRALRCSASTGEISAGAKSERLLTPPFAVEGVAMTLGSCGKIPKSYSSDFSNSAYLEMRMLKSKVRKIKVYSVWKLPPKTMIILKQVIFKHCKISTSRKSASWN